MKKRILDNFTFQLDKPIVSIMHNFAVLKGKIQQRKNGFKKMSAQRTGRTILQAIRGRVK